MRIPLVAAVLLGICMFGAGYAAGQLRGVLSGSAQSPVSGASGNALRPGGTLPRIGSGPGGSQTPHVHGRVTAMNGNTLTISPMPDPGGDGASATRVVLTPSTQYGPGFARGAGERNSIKVGAAIVARGTLSSDGATLTAQQVMLVSAGGFGSPDGRGFRSGGPPGFGAPGASGSARAQVSGTVRAIKGDTLSITPAVSPGGAASSSIRIVVLTSSTIYNTGFAGAGGKATIKVGTLIAAEGTVSGDGTSLTARFVRIEGTFGARTPGRSGAGSSL